MEWGPSPASLGLHLEFLESSEAREKRELFSRGTINEALFHFGSWRESGEPERGVVLPRSGLSQPWSRLNGWYRYFDRNQWNTVVLYHL